MEELLSARDSKLETLAQTWHARISYRLQAPKIFPKQDHFPVTSRQGGLETSNPDLSGYQVSSES